MIPEPAEGRINMDGGGTLRELIDRRVRGIVWGDRDEKTTIFKGPTGCLKNGSPEASEGVSYSSKVKKRRQKGPFWDHFGILRGDTQNPERSQRGP